MIQISNAEKQARFRKKEHLKRLAENIYRKWELSVLRWNSKRAPQEVRAALEKAVELPSGWTDDDYEHALKRLGQYQLDLDFSVDQIANDVNGAAFPNPEFMTTTDPVKYIADNKAAIENARALASHIISALKLSNCDDAKQAAALMEALRFVGRSLASNREVHCSSATALCLASIGPQYDRPDWFAKKLAETLGAQMNNHLAHKVGQYLSNKGTP